MKTIDKLSRDEKGKFVNPLREPVPQADAGKSTDKLGKIFGVAARIKHIFESEAKERQTSSLKQFSPLAPNGHNGEKGRSRNKAAELVGSSETPHILPKSPPCKDKTCLYGVDAYISAGQIVLSWCMSTNREQNRLNMRYLYCETWTFGEISCQVPIINHYRKLKQFKLYLELDKHILKQYNKTNLGGDIIDEIFTVREAAERLKITEQAVRDYIASGQLEASKLGRVWRITETDIIKFLQNMKPAKDTPAAGEVDHDTE